jgi:hypothetical protein
MQIREYEREMAETTRMMRNLKRLIDADDKVSVFNRLMPDEHFFRVLIRLYAMTDSFQCCWAYTQWYRPQSRGLQDSTRDLDQADLVECLRTHGQDPWLRAQDENKQSRYHYWAAKFIAEHDVFVEMCMLNSKGIAPPTRELVKIMLQSWPNESKGNVAVSFLAELETNDRFANNWIRTFRRLWQVSYAAMPARSCLSDDQVREKVKHKILKPWYNTL